MSAPVWIGVAALGGLGAVARVWLAEVVQRRARSGFPLGTLAVNLSGSFALGVLIGAGVGGDALLLAGGGLLGSFTTFSTWMLQTEQLADYGDRTPAFAYVALSVAGGLAAAGAGWALGAAL
jgi:fluoride exporter